MIISSAGFDDFWRTSLKTDQYPAGFDDFWRTALKTNQQPLEPNNHIVNEFSTFGTPKPSLTRLLLSSIDKPLV